MRENIVEKLIAKDDKYACALADKIISESQKTDKWYEYFDNFASLLNHPKSLVRNRVLYILAANAQVGLAKPQYIPRILLCLREADLSKYKDSMHPLIEKDIVETEKILTDFEFEG